jgi:hypothetical protein
LPQAPQWAASVWVLRHAPPQRVSLVAHRQLPASQRCPEAQALPHAPQWSASLWSVTHALAHTDCPDGQLN